VSMRGLLGVVISASAVVAMLGTATRGFSALSTDAARALDVARSPVVVPPVALLDQFGTRHTIHAPDRSTIVDFVYTRCLTVCSELGGVFQQLQATIRARGLESRVRLLSVSFDPTWDTPARLGPYNVLMRADPAIWTITTPQTAGPLPTLLRTFGVRVIDDGANGFAHNAALHVVDPEGRLVAILPIDAIDEALAVAVAHATPPPMRP
jgi:protein SCO1